MNLDFDLEEQYGNNRFPETVKPHDEDWALVDKRWKEYGIE